MTTLIVAASIAVLFLVALVAVLLWLGVVSYRGTRGVGETIRRNDRVRDLKPEDIVHETKKEDEDNVSKADGK